MTILPPAASINRNNATVSDDFPAPVLPTIPTYNTQKITKIISNREEIIITRLEHHSEDQF
jgi:hypothetical protein